jgi:hypothetical protein
LQVCAVAQDAVNVLISLFGDRIGGPDPQAWRGRLEEVRWAIRIGRHDTYDG